MYSNALASLAAAVLLFSSALEIAASSSNGAGHAINHVPLDARHGRLQRARRVANNSSWNLMAACITDAPAPGRLLSVSSNLPTTLTPAVCQRACDAGGYVYAGLQYGDECWCAHELNYNANAGQAAKNATACNYPCSGDKSQQCGGFWHVTLYSKETGKTTTSAPAPTTSTSIAVSSTTSATHATPAVPPSSYKLVSSMSGSNFFSHFDFFTKPDPTNGQVNYLNQLNATNAKLAYIEEGTNAAVMRVDNTSKLLSGVNRNSVRISSKASYATGLMVFDIAEMPYGCSVWPALWTTGPNWPNQGEIDIIEGVNLNKVNQLTLHTGPSTSCNTSAVSPGTVSSNALGPTCASAPASDSGCGWQDTSPTAYGAGFNNAGGAVFALEIAKAGVTIWKFARDAIPADITAGKPDPTSGGWVKPQALWPSSNSCATNDVIGAQTIIFDMTLCGGWAQSDYPTSGCPGTCSEQVQTGSNFLNAIWKVNSVKVYQQ